MVGDSLSLKQRMEGLSQGFPLVQLWMIAQDLLLVRNAVRENVGQYLRGILARTLPDAMQ